MHLAPHVFVKTLAMAYVFIETCLALDMAYIPFEMHLGLTTVNIFVRMHFAHNIIFNVLLETHTKIHFSLKMMKNLLHCNLM
jgi:hypothetical protein